MQRSIYLLLFALCCACISCATEQLEAGFVYVPEIRVASINGNQPSDTVRNDARELRVVRGAQNIGVYPLPARIPVLQPQGQVLRLEPVVRRAGVAEQRLAYPFYEALTLTLDVGVGEVDTLFPLIEYAEGVQLAYGEFFGGPDVSINNDVDGDATTRIETQFSDGRSFGRALLSTDSPILEVVTEVIELDASLGNQVWLELDYRGDALVQVALLPVELGTPQQRGARYTQGVFGRDEFKHFYFDMVNEFAAPLVQARAFRLGLLASRDINNDGEQTVDIDDLRLLVR